MKKTLTKTIVMTFRGLIYGVALQVFFLSMLLAKGTEAQIIQSVRDVKISVDLRDASLRECFTEIEKKTSYRFSYDHFLIDNNIKISLNSKGKVLSELLLEISREAELKFKQINNTINVQKMDNLSEGQQLEIVIQGITITGRVISDEDQGGLPGVNVVLKGTTQGTVTDVEGNYSIDVPDENAVLVFSSVGYISEEVLVGASSVINMTLVPDITALEEIVVIGYGIQKKSDLTGAISQVKSSDMENRTITRPEQALQGKVAGVQVIQTSGAPGKSSTVRIRGFSSNSSSDPLYVVDGLRTDDIGAIDPNNIASIEVLKDAASAAIYGQEAGNGVILITTKTGTKGSSKITYDFQLASNSLTRIPKVLNANEYINYMTEANFIAVDEISNLWDGTTDTDWTDVAFESSLMQRHNLGFQGGSDKGSYYLSLSYLDQDGIVKGNADTYKRLTAMINADYQVAPWMKVGVTTTIERWKSRSVSENNEYGSLLASVLTMDPLTGDVYDADNLPAHMQSALDAGRPLLTNEQGQYYGISAVFASEQVHPMIMRDRAEPKPGGANILGTIYTDVTPFEGFTFTSKLGYRGGFFNDYNFDHIYYGSPVATRDNINVTRTNTTSYYYQWENFANYLFNIGDNNFTVMFGTSFVDNESISVTGGGNDITKNDPLFRDLNYLTPTANRTVSGGYNLGRQWSYFGRLIYNYKDKYLLQASVRRDAGDLSILPVENRWGTFPAVSAGYVISNENFFPQETIISQLKLRASWGQNGSTGPLGGYAYRSAITGSESYPFSSAIDYQIGSAPNTLDNPEMRWETSEQLDLGLDLRVFNDRLTFTFDYFEKKTKDLLVQVTPPYPTGVSSVTVNAGNVLNTGFEFELGWKDDINDFSYSVDANLATLNNEVTYLDPSISRIRGASFHTIQGITAFEVGYPIWYMRGYELEDIDNETGDPIFVDQKTIDSNNDGIPDEADGVINDEDKVMIGSAIPDFTYGFTLNAGYKGFDLIVFGAGSYGNDIYNTFTRTDRPRGNKLKVFYDERWTPENPEASRPRPGGNDNYWVSSGVIFKGSFFKLKQLQLGYTLPKPLLQNTFIGNVRAYVSLEDWFVLTNYPGMDPEASAGSGPNMGVDKGSYPNYRKAVFGLNLTF
jgi:TonB-linked SusC/RagA family outer membrane protein